MVYSDDTVHLGAFFGGLKVDWMDSTLSLATKVPSFCPFLDRRRSNLVISLFKPKLIKGIDRYYAVKTTHVPGERHDNGCRYMTSSLSLSSVI